MRVHAFNNPWKLKLAEGGPHNWSELWQFFQHRRHLWSCTTRFGFKMQFFCVVISRQRL